MQAFLYLDLTASPSFQQPAVAAVKKALPDVSVLDVDTRSDEMLQHYALRMLREATRAVVCLKADENTANFGSIMPLLEELLQGQEQRLVLLLGQHPRLRRMFQARPHVLFQEVAEEELVGKVRVFLG